MKTGLMIAGMACVAWAMVVQAAEPKLEIVRQALIQGGFVVAQVPPGSTVTLEGEAVTVGPKGEVVIGFARDAKPRMSLKVCDVANECSSHELTIAARTYKTQNVKGVPPKSVDPDPAELARMKADNAATQAARDKAREAARWRSAFMDGFALPIEAPTSGVYGSRRTYTGQERSWHKGHDLAAKTGTPIKAPADGVVRLARDTFMSGNLIMLDHGGALTTVYAHLDSIAVKPGDSVTRGQVIGRVGTTGRSSGPHLHWGAYWRNEAIDPILWTKP